MPSVITKSGKEAFPWTHKEKPSVNHWYMTMDEPADYWKIMKDFYSKDRNITYYKIVTYYNGDNLYCCSTLAQARELIRDNTYRKVVMMNGL